MKNLANNNKRRGIIAPLTAFFMIFLIGMVAFAVDIGWIVLSETNLQNAADAAALAGANPLMDGYVQYNLATDSTTKTTVLNAALANARAKAKLYAGYNSAGTVSSLVLNDSDIEFGFIDSQNNYTPMPTYTGYPNTIKVLLRLDSQANKPLNLFFGPVLGTATTNLNATASATLYAGSINRFNIASTMTGLMPVTFDVNQWNNYLKTGQSPDGSISKDASGIPQIQVYPSLKFPGNFGQLSLNDSHVGASTEKSWVDSGVPSSDIQALINANLIPLSKHDSTKWDWQGDTGFKASLVMTINNHVNQTFILPLFKPVDASQANYQAGTGQGANFFYNIVQFVGIRIMPTSDNNGQVVVEPVAIIEPNAILDPSTIAPVGTTSTIVTTFTTPKLSR